MCFLFIMISHIIRAWGQNNMQSHWKTASHIYNPRSNNQSHWETAPNVYRPRGNNQSHRRQPSMSTDWGVWWNLSWPSEETHGGCQPPQEISSIASWWHKLKSVVTSFRAGYLKEGQLVFNGWPPSSFSSTFTFHGDVSFPFWEPYEYLWTDNPELWNLVWS